MLIIKTSRESNKLKAAALLNKLKHRSARFFKFSSDESHFQTERKSNKKNDSWIWKELLEVSVEEHIKCLSSLRVFEFISTDGPLLPAFFFNKNLRFTAKVYQEDERSVVKPWMDWIANSLPHLF